VAIATLSFEIQLADIYDKVDFEAEVLLEDITL
jgi:hypothetical protein